MRVSLNDDNGGTPKTMGFNTKILLKKWMMPGGTPMTFEKAPPPGSSNSTKFSLS